MSLSIVHHPHPTLRYKSKTIRRVDRELKSIIAEMLDLMYEHKGVGLAANQVAVPLRIFVANPAGERGEGEEIVCINPELNLPGGSAVEREGCLSLPGVWGEVTRPARIRLSAYDAAGNPIERKLEGFLARVVQHEIDHLNGVLFFDRMNPDERSGLKGQLQELEAAYRAKQEANELPSDEEAIRRLAEWESRYA